MARTEPAEEGTRRQGARRSDSLARGLSRLAAARSEGDLSRRLARIAADHFAAAGAMMLCRDPGVAPPGAVAHLCTGSGAAGPAALDPDLVARLREGAPVVSDRPARDLSGLALPAGTCRAVLVPCGGEDAASALCMHWRDVARRLRAADLDRLGLVAAAAGLALERQLAGLRARQLQADLDNRIRNVLAVIRSVGTRSAERASSIEDFLLHFEGRIDAIGRSQIAAARTPEISLEALLREELLAQSIQDAPGISLDGIDVLVTAEQAEALGLAIHELAVNSVKFGAMAGPAGRLRVRWWTEPAAGDLALNIDWRESVGPGAGLRPPERAGFGLTYLERALPFQLNAHVVLDFRPDGLRCQIAVPMETAAQRGEAPSCRAAPRRAPFGRPFHLPQARD